jgi:hypothetical protein
MHFLSRSGHNNAGQLGAARLRLSVRLPGSAIVTWGGPSWRIMRWWGFFLVAAALMERFATRG